MPPSIIPLILPGFSNQFSCWWRLLVQNHLYSHRRRSLQGLCYTGEAFQNPPVNKEKPQGIKLKLPSPSSYLPLWWVWLVHSFVGERRAGQWPLSFPLWLWTGLLLHLPPEPLPFLQVCDLLSMKMCGTLSSRQLLRTWGWVSEPDVSMEDQTIDKSGYLLWGDSGLW